MSKRIVIPDDHDLIDGNHLILRPELSRAIPVMHQIQRLVPDATKLANALHRYCSLALDRPLSQDFNALADDLQLALGAVRAAAEVLGDIEARSVELQMRGAQPIRRRG